MAEFTTVDFNGNFEYVFKTETLAGIDYFSAGKPKYTILTDFNVEYRHVNTLAKVISGIKVIPTIDLNSHMDVLVVIKLSKLLKISQQTLIDGFSLWTSPSDWAKLWNPEYVYLIYREVEELVDIRKFFRMCNVFESIPAALELPEIKNNPELYVELLMFFKNYKFEDCFDQNNPKVQEKINALTQTRNKYSNLFLINLFKFSKEFFKYAPSLEDVWTCKGISVVNELPIGAITISDENTIKERVNEFTYSIFDKPLNTAVTKQFPFDNVVFAGGAVTKLIDVNYDKRHARQSDVDLFIYAPTFEARSRVFNEIIEWFKSPNTYYAVRGSVTTIYVKDMPRKFQVISNNSTNIYDVIARFDLTHIQWCYCKYNGELTILGTPEACISMRSKVTKVNNSNRLRVQRFVKALHNGYSIYKDPHIVDNYMDITDLIDKPSVQLDKLINDLYGFYYPVSVPDMDDNELHKHILCMIGKDANVEIVTKDASIVLNNVVIGGNFENDYESRLFSTFNPNCIVNKAQGRNIRRIILRTKCGILRLTSSILKVTKILNSAEGICITVHVNDDAFREFCTQLETNVYRMFGRREHVTHKCIDDNGNITFIIPKYRLNNQNVRGVSCLRDQRNMALNIEEDLREGDDVQVLFNIEIINTHEERCVNIKPIKYIKYCDAQTHAGETEDVDEQLQNLSIKDEIDLTYEEILP